MEFGGRYLFDAKRGEVWSALNDAAILKAVIPGCERIEWVGADALELAIRVNFGLLHPVFAGDLRLSNVIPAESYTLAGKGRGGMLGLAQGAADISLADAAGGTLLTFLAHGRADGGVMRLGKALLGNSAQKVIDGFFASIGNQMGVSVAAQPWAL
jgi:carbon monoxide dehydrogenase subunit G